MVHAALGPRLQYFFSLNEVVVEEAITRALCLSDGRVQVHRDRPGNNKSLFTLIPEYPLAHSDQFSPIVKLTRRHFLAHLGTEKKNIFIQKISLNEDRDSCDFIADHCLPHLLRPGPTLLVSLCNLWNRKDKKKKFEKKIEIKHCLHNNFHNSARYNGVIEIVDVKTRLKTFSHRRIISASGWALVVGESFIKSISKVCSLEFQVIIFVLHIRRPQL